MLMKHAQAHVIMHISTNEEKSDGVKVGRVLVDSVNGIVNWTQISHVNGTKLPRKYGPKVVMLVAWPC